MGVNYTIPDHLLDQLYVATNSSPNSDVFTQNKLQRLPIPVLGLDNITSWLSDCLQDAQKQINQIEVQGIGVQGNQNQFLYFSADNVLGAINLQDMLNALGALVFDGSNISAGTIYGKSIRNQTITGENIKNLTLEDAQINNVSGIKILVGSMPFSRLVAPKSASVLGGTTTTNLWYEVSVGNYQIVTKLPQNGGTSAVGLDTIFNNTPGTPFNGSKLTPASINGAIAITSNSTPLGVMKSAGTATSVVCGRTTDQKFVEVNLNALQVISVLSNGTTPSAMNLSTVFNNEAGTPYNGSQLTDGSVPYTKLAPNPVTAFAWARVDGSGNVLNGYNIQSVVKNSDGKYTVKFLSAAPNTNYCLTMTAFNGNGQNSINVACPYEGTQMTGQFDCWTKSSGVYSNTGFYVAVFSA